MGSAISCKKCSIAQNSSVINLSDSLISRIVDGVEEPYTKGLSGSGEDEEWIRTLQCLDDAHSVAYGLIPEEIHALIERVEGHSQEHQLTEHCSDQQIKNCFKYNPNCTLNCTREIEEFISCLDAKRLQRLKILLEKDTEEQKKKKEYNTK